MYVVKKERIIKIKISNLHCYIISFSKITSYCLLNIKYHSHTIYMVDWKYMKLRKLVFIHSDTHTLMVMCYMLISVTDIFPTITSVGDTDVLHFLCLF